jgi:hypothetical protein
VFTRDATLDVFENDSLLVRTGYSIKFRERADNGDPVGTVELQSAVKGTWSSVLTIKLGRETLLLINPDFDDCFGWSWFTPSE